MEFKTIADYRQEVKQDACNWLVDHYDEFESYDFWMDIAPDVLDGILSKKVTWLDACENVKFIAWDKRSLDYVKQWVKRMPKTYDDPVKLDMMIRIACFNEKIFDIKTAFDTLEYNREFGIDDDESPLI